jgi:hypothetical protein
VPRTNIYDFNRDRIVNAIDESIARLATTNPITTVKYLNLISPPVEALVAAGVIEDEPSAISTAVAIASSARSPVEFAVHPDRPWIDFLASQQQATPPPFPTPSTQFESRQPVELAIDELDDDLLALLLARLAE